MKAHREPPKFTPVTLVLETQEEVDALQTLLNHARLLEHVGLPMRVHEVLKDFASPDEDERHQRLCNFLKTLSK